ncbi:MAG: Tetratricopeptide repeat protein, partial [Myxococcaceae bacterium]|nr:Tetratricopeptide repeat protein [Myxococcaceae bacterium]
MTRRLTAVLVLAALAAPAVGRAQEGPNATLVATGRQQFDDLRYEEAVQTLSAALLRRGNTAAQEVGIYELLALSYLALNRDEESEGAFRLMLARDPEHALGASQAPRIRDFFSGVAERWRREGASA